MCLYMVPLNLGNAIINAIVTDGLSPSVLLLLKENFMLCL